MDGEMVNCTRTRNGVGGGNVCLASASLVGYGRP